MKYAVLLAVLLTVAGCGGGGGGSDDGGDPTPPSSSSPGSGGGDGSSGDSGSGDSGSGDSGSGDSTGGSDTSSGGDPEPDPIEAPVNLELVGVSGNVVTIRWEHILNTGLEFIIERRGDAGAFEQVAAMADDNNEFTDSNLEFETTYIYRVYAKNNETQSEYSNELSVTTGTELLSDAWIRLYHSPSGNMEPKALLALDDGSYVAAGFPGFEVDYFKVDASGKVVWANEFNQDDTGGKVEIGGMARTAEGDIVFLLTSRRYTNNYYYQLIKVKGSDGTKLWEQRYISSIASTDDFTRLVASDENMDGVTDSFLIGGSRSYIDDRYVEVVKLNSLGDVLWSTQLETTEGVNLVDLYQDSESNIYVMSNQGGFLGIHPRVVKLDSNGNIIYQRRYPPFTEGNFFLKVQFAEDKDPNSPADMLLVGTADIEGGTEEDTRPVVIGLDEFGNVVSSYQYGSSVPFNDVRSVKVDEAGDIWMLASREGSFSLSKMSPAGAFQKHVDVSVGGSLVAGAFTFTPDGQPIVATQGAFDERGNMAIWRFSAALSFAFEEGYNASISSFSPTQETYTLLTPIETTLFGTDPERMSDSTDIAPVEAVEVNMINVANGSN